MTAAAVPSWLADFQARFGDTVRTPLDRTTGMLAATPAAYDRALAAEVAGGDPGAGGARLAVYNRQYWFRLLGVLHDAYPLTARLTGYWSFNEHAAAHLAEHPPRTWDSGDVAAGFAASFVAAVGEGDPERRALCDSARIDAAYRAVFHAPAVSPFRPSEDDASRLLEAQLLPSPAVARIREHAPLIDLRRQLLAAAANAAAEDRLAVPPPLASPRDWALVRGEAGTASVLLEPREAELLELLDAHPVGDALARLERRCPVGEREALPAATRRWLARGVALGFWAGVSYRR